MLDPEPIRKKSDRLDELEDSLVSQAFQELSGPPEVVRRRLILFTLREVGVLLACAAVGFAVWYRLSSVWYGLTAVIYLWVVMQFSFLPIRRDLRISFRRRVLVAFLSAVIVSALLHFLFGREWLAAIAGIVTLFAVQGLYRGLRGHPSKSRCP